MRKISWGVVVMGVFMLVAVRGRAEMLSRTDGVDILKSEGVSLSAEDVGGRMQLASSYADGSGRYINSDEVHHYASGVKCWSDYFVVDSGYWWDAWHKASGNLYCTGTSSCSFSHMDGHQTCETWSASFSAGIKSDLISFEVSLGYDHQTCNTGTDVSQCTWSDQQCHCIWSQQQMTYQHGYKRRRCSSSNGDYTAWMEDFSHDAPTGRVSYGCGSKCTDTDNYVLY